MFETIKQKRGFAVMSKEKRSVISSKGGIAAHKAGTAHEWNSESARTAGKLGGYASNGGRGKNTRKVKN